MGVKLSVKPCLMSDQSIRPAVALGWMFSHVERWLKLQLSCGDKKAALGHLCLHVFGCQFHSTIGIDSCYKEVMLRTVGHEEVIDLWGHVGPFSHVSVTICTECCPQMICKNPMNHITFTYTYVLVYTYI